MNESAGRSSSLQASPRRRRAGLTLALAASAVSGVAVFLNGYAVKHVHATPTAYTTAKNLVAALVLGAVFLRGTGRIRLAETPGRRDRGMTWLGLAYIGLVGGGLAFALFFEGLAQTSSTTAAFVQKSLVIWVVAMAAPILGERIGPAQAAAIALLLTGAVAVGAGHGLINTGHGPLLVLVATLLWAIEVVVAKRVLMSVPARTVSLTRMGIGSATLLCWLAATGRLTQLTRLDRSGWAWVLMTGVMLAAYVGLWFAALARGRAIDVTAVLVSAAFVTAALSAGVQGRALPHPWGLLLVALGTGLAAAAWRPARKTSSQTVAS
jgi:drug/metabolite transporter (DMT)-like permease